MTDAPTPQRFRTLVLLYPVLDARWGSGLAAQARAPGHDARGARRHRRRRRAAPRRRSQRWSDGLAALAPLDVIEVRRPIRSLSSSGGGRWWVGPREVRPALERARGARPLRLDLRALAGRSRGAAVRLGLHARTVRGDLRGGLQLDLDRPLADARHRPGPGAGLRPRVAPPGRVGLPVARTRSRTSCRVSTMRATSRRRATRRSRRSGAPMRSTTTGTAGGPGPGRGRRGTATG